MAHESGAPRRRWPWVQLFYWLVFASGAMGLARAAKTPEQITFAVGFAAVSFPLAFFLLWFIGLLAQQVSPELAEKARQDRKSRVGIRRASVRGRQEPGHY